MSFAEPESVDMPAFAGTVSLRYSRPVTTPGPSAIPSRKSGRVTTMHVRRNQLTIAAVAFVLGLLVVVQLRAQAGTSGLEQLSTQDLTVLVANLNARNDQLRNEVATLDRELSTLTNGQARGAQSVDQIRSDLRRVRAYAGLDPVTGPGVTISVSGPIDGPALEALANELRNAGAEAIEVAGVRLVPGVVDDRHGPVTSRSTACRSTTRSTSTPSAHRSSSRDR